MDVVWRAWPAFLPERGTKCIIWWWWFQIFKFFQLKLSFPHRPLGWEASPIWELGATPNSTVVRSMWNAGTYVRISFLLVDAKNTRRERRSSSLYWFKISFEGKGWAWCPLRGPITWWCPPPVSEGTSTHMTRSNCYHPLPDISHVSTEFPLAATCLRSRTRDPVPKITGTKRRI